MAINNNDDVQSQINNLNNNVKKLTDTVNNLSRTLADSTRASKKTAGEISHDISKTFLNKITLAIKEGLSSAKDKSNDKFYTKKGELRDNKQVNKIINNFAKQLDESLAEQKILLSSYNKDHKNNPEEDLTKVYEACKILVPSIKEWGESLNLSKDTIKGILQEAEISKNLNATKEDKITISDFRQVIKDELGNVTGVLNTGGPFAVPKEDAKKLSQELANVSTQLKQTQDTLKLTNDVVLDLATNSDTVNRIMLDMNVNMEMANENLRIFNMLLDSTSNAQWRQETSINSSLQAMGQMRTVMLQMQASMHQLTNANVAALQNLRNTLNDGGSTQGSSNTFQQQATRNSDRAKQVGFIAMLIPALAKLLKKTPITDFLRYLALKLGSGFSGRGDHPVLGTLGLGAATLVPAALTTKWASKLLFGKNAILGGAGEVAAKGSVGRIPWNQLPKYAKGMVAGATSTHLDRLGANVDRVGLGMGEFAKDNMGNYLFDKNGNRILTSRTGNVAGGFGYERGRLLARNLPRQMKVGVGRVAQRVPILGTAISAAFEVPDLIKAGKSGDKEVWGNQLAKSTGGVAGGTIGAIAGGALGSLVGPIGTIIGGAIGGFIGDAIGRFVGPPIRKGFQNAMSGLKGTFESIKEHTKGVKEGFGKLGKSFGRIGAAFGNLFSPITSRLGKWANKVQSWIGKLISSGVEKTIEWIVKGIDNFVTKIDKTVNTIADLIDTIADGFHDLGQKLLSTPIIGPILQKIYGETPETNTVTNNTNEANRKESERVNKELLKYQDPNSKEYKAKRQEFYDQYIRANKSGWFVGAEENTKLENEANKWADKMMNEEKYKLKVQKAALENGIGTSALPSNLTTVKKNGVDAVAMKDLGLNGAIGKGNSVPYIAAANAQNLKNLDNYLSSKGYKFTYTSAMGGSHAGGAKSHGAGQKVDLVLNQGGKLKPEDERWLMANGFYGGATGAVGYHNAGSGYHYDLSVSGGKGLTAAQMAEQQKTATQTATTTQTKEETASSQIREDLAAIVGAKDKSAKQERARSVIFSAVDVTGSLGVWGITQLNNGVMRTGR